MRADLTLVLAAAVPLVLFTIRERLVAGTSGFPLDDSWIHLHFARNVAAGLGFVYNPGRPMAGSTAPLWTLLLAAGAFVAGATVVMAKVIGVACAIGAALVTRRAALAWGASPAAATVGAVALLWTGPIAWGGLSGMEVTLASLLVAGALLALARDQLWWTVALASLAVLARPEAALLLPLLALARPLAIGRIAAFVLVPAAVLAPMVAFAWATVGAPYPATAAAKVEGGLIGWLAGTHEPLEQTLLFRPWAFAREWIAWLWQTHPLLPLALLALPLAWRRGGRALGVTGLALLAHPLGMALLAPYRGPGFQEGRYSIHLLPLAVVVLAVAFDATPARLRRPVLALWLALALWTLVPASERYAWGVENIEAMQVKIGHWVDTNLPPKARLALNDIGAIAFVSRREVIDLMGLVTPEILPYRRQGEDGVIRYVTEVCPEYVIIFPTWFPRLAGRTDLIEPLYRVVLPRVEVSGGPEMVVYRLKGCAV